MFLKKLEIRVDGTVIREIPFHKGVNFIVDSTPITSGKESGNNVGKTTVLRLIDYCLGSKGKDIYSDTEFRDKTNNDVKEFLQNKAVEIELTLTRNIDDPQADTVSIVRNFLARKQKATKFNGEPVTIEGLKSALNNVLFGNTDDKPPYRNLIAKFVRDTPQKMSMTLRFLHSTTTLAEYEALHLFLLGIRLPDNLLLEKSILIRRISADERLLDRLTETETENGLVQALEIIQREIESLEQKKASYSREQLNDGTVEKINALKKDIGKLTEQIADKELRLRLANESLVELKGGIQEYDVNEVRQIYENANALIANMQTRFEDVVAFHQSMLDSKIRFISQDLPALQEQLENLKLQRGNKIANERQLTELLNNRISLEEYDNMLNELNSRHELKGSRAERLRQIREIKQSIGTRNARLADINVIIDEAEKALVNNEIVFNKYFSALSKELYEEEFYLSHVKNDSDDVYVFEINSIQSNMGGGKKKGQIAAFDLAYMHFCEEMQIKAPRFVLHDSTEDVSINQLMKIADSSSKVNGQYILAILSDKFKSHPDGERLIDKGKVVVLSQDDKLFRF